MLESLRVKNLALIEEAEVEFGSGLNILTGETGAGKSILIGSINLALGEKASTDMIRSGEESAYVELTFGISGKTRQRLKELEIEAEDDALILSRKISRKRSVCRVNGEVVSMADLKKIASILIDIHGQHKHQSLLYKNRQLEIVDDFAKEELGEWKKELAEKVRSFRQTEAELEKNGLSEEERNRKISFLAYEINEIEEAAVKEGEDEQLENEYRRLSNAENIRESLMRAVSFLNEEEVYSGNSDSGGALLKIGHAISALSKEAEAEEELSSYLEELRTAEDLLSEAIRKMRNYLNDFEFDEERLSCCSQRIDEIQRLKNKYGATIEKINAYAENAKKELEELEHQEERRAGLLRQKDELRIKIEALAGKISSIRESYGKKLEKQIIKALRDLNFLEVRFEISFKKKEEFTENGWDEVEFLISTNPGEEMRPLGKIASGGELSRIMLAIKSVLASEDEIEALIFDEIDTGISGRTAQMVSEKLAALSLEHQILCITHLPQIAAMADQHFEIRKTTENDRTITKIHELSEEESVHELARILGGAQITDAVRKNAKEMKKLAKTIRRKK